MLAWISNMHTDMDQPSSNTMYLKYMNSNNHYRFPFLRKRSLPEEEGPILVFRGQTNT